ncbi:MAG: copper homeostasis protein CutC, partial [Asticcacaulis sp.]|nr:copper homeostasis protein CutC [Asticcacaulis sp.]
GANLASGELDVATLETLVDHARDLDLEITLHHSFDLMSDPETALNMAIVLGFDTVLTSGGGKSAADGTANLRARVVQARGTRVEILAGSGVTAGNVGDIFATGVTAIHASCSAALPVRSPRAAELGYAAPDQRDTDPILVAALRAALDRFERASYVVR